MANSKADVRRRKANDYATPGWEKQGKEGLSNAVKSVDDKQTMRRIGEVVKAKPGTPANKNQRQEVLEALRATDKIGEKEYKKRKKAM